MKDNSEIQPKLHAIGIDHEWTDQQDKNRWAKIIAIHLEDTLHREGFLKRKNREIGEIFYLLVCSNQFKAKPDQDWKDEEFNKAFIQDNFVREEVIEYVKDVVDSIGPVTTDQFDKSMTKRPDPGMCGMLYNN